MMYISKRSSATIADYVGCLGCVCISNALRLLRSGYSLAVNTCNQGQQQNCYQKSPHFSPLSTLTKSFLHQNMTECMEILIFILLHHNY